MRNINFYMIYDNFYRVYYKKVRDFKQNDYFDNNKAFRKCRNKCIYHKQ